MAEADSLSDASDAPVRVWALATVGWAMLFLAAVYAGRLTVLPGTSLNLLWPAAGVAVVWFTLHLRSRIPWLDVAALAAIIIAIDVATGTTVLLGAGFAVANLAQTLLAVRFFVRWCPDLWLSGGAEPLSRVSQFWRLGAAAAAGSTAGAVIGPAAVWLLADGSWSPLLVLVWLVRNTVGIVLAGVVALQLEYVWLTHAVRGPAPRRPPWVGRPVAVRNWLHRKVTRHVWEGLALCLVTAASYAAVFPLGNHAPLGFTLLGVTVWAGLRFGTTFVALHGLAASVAAVAFTLQGHGPFAAIGSEPGRALATQALVGMICVVGLCLALGRRERAELLHRARAAEHDARSQADVFATIVETMGAGLVVVGAHGEPMLGNLAAHHLTTPGAGSTGRSGRIPAPRAAPGAPPPSIDALPFREALAGRAVESADVVIGGARPDHRTLNVSAAPLPARVGGGAVLVFTDVTQERRERDELSAFAGVVAHDLLNPLTAMSGWADLLSSLLSRAAPDPMVTMATESLTWIQEAADRASTLVGELLAYTTAGDAPISASDVDLANLVSDLVDERSRTPLAPMGDEERDGEDDEKPPLLPEFEIGALGHVVADPVLIRQLLSNLIDNAIKYVAPGEAPRLRIGMTPVAPGRVCIEVADRGIGIPAGQHEAVFENFQRAHRDLGYPGSGIGLAICRRIVERHGGTITAQDNDGGGTVFAFTLPTARLPS